MPFFLLISEGDDAAMSEPVLAVSDPTLVARVLALIGHHLADQGRFRRADPRPLQAIPPRESDGGA
jgi:hypothetical protein